MDDRSGGVRRGLRGAMDHEADPHTIPGALRMTAEELSIAIMKYQGSGRDSFCACPNELTAARMALMLRSGGSPRSVRLPADCRVSRAGISAGSAPDGWTQASVSSAAN